MKQTPEEKLAELEDSLKAKDLEIKALKTTIKENETNLDELNSVNNDLQNSIDDLERKLGNEDDEVAEEKKAVIPTKSFKVGNETHVFNVPQFTNPLDGGQVITAEEALTNPELLEYLVTNGCGVTNRKGAKK